MHVKKTLNNKKIAQACAQLVLALAAPIAFAHDFPGDSEINKHGFGPVGLVKTVIDNAFQVQ